MISHGGGLEFEKGERETTVYRGAGLRVTFNDSPSGGKGSAPPIDAHAPDFLFVAPGDILARDWHGSVKQTVLRHFFYYRKRARETRK